MKSSIAFQLMAAIYKQIRIVLIAVWIVAASAVHADGETIVADVFNIDLPLPSSCVLQVRPSIQDKDIRFSCNTDDPATAVYIHFVPAATCIAYEIRLSPYRVESKKYQQDGLTYVSRANKLDEESPTMYQRLVWDEEVCVVANAGSLVTLRNLLSPIWQ